MAKNPADEAAQRLDEADDALAEGEPEQALDAARRGAKLARKAGDRVLESDLVAAEAAALTALGDAPAALARADAALALDPASVGARYERGAALYELCRFAEARAALEAVLADAPDDAGAEHLLGLVAEREGRRAEADRRIARARRLDPDAFPREPRMSRREFDGAVEAALEEIPPKVRDYLANVPVTVEDLPSDDDLRSGDPPLSPSILGLFRGAPHGRKHADPWGAFPSAIVLFQRNLERFARDREELVREIGVTLVHEVAHYLGLDDDELWARGLD